MVSIAFICALKMADLDSTKETFLMSPLTAV